MRVSNIIVSVLLTVFVATAAQAGSVPARATGGMVVSQNAEASRVGVEVLKEGGTAVDAAIATAFALAVTHPAAGNIGGGGFLVFHPSEGETAAFDFREVAPAKASASMWLNNGQYDARLHHASHLAVGVPGTVAGLYLAWSEHGKLPWKRLVKPSVELARDGVVITHGLARSFKRVLPRMKQYPPSVAKFTNGGTPYEAGDLWRQPDLEKTLQRIADSGPDGFYAGETAALIEKEMLSGGGLITKKDLADYEAKRRKPIRGSYRGCEIISMPPPSSGGVTLVEMLNILEGFDLVGAGFGSARNVHVYAEAMKRAYADRARYLGDPDWNPDMPLARLTSKEYAVKLRSTIFPDRATKSSPQQFHWPRESTETTHVSVVDAERNAVALTYTLEYGFGSAIVVPGAGFLLNNEMGDFNPVAGLTTDQGLIGTDANLTAPGKRMLSSMTPTIVTKDGILLMVTGTPGGRTIINTVMQTIVHVVDFGMNAQEAVDAARIHHQWLPDEIVYERNGLSPDTLRILERLGHTVAEENRLGAAQVIVVNDDVLEGGSDRRVADGAAVGY